MDKIKLMQQLMVICLFTIMFSSCQKDEETTPDYVGTWTRSETITEEGVTVDFKTTLTLTASKYTELVQMKTGEKFLDLIKITGALSVSGDVMTIDLQSIAVTSYSITGMPTGTLVTYNENSAEFNQFLSLFEIDKTQTASYTVVGKTLNVGGYTYTRK
jgi:hypothetical protein